MDHTEFSAYRPSGRVIHAARKVQPKGAPEGYFHTITRCGVDLGSDYSVLDAPETLIVTCRRCKTSPRPAVD